MASPQTVQLPAVTRALMAVIGAEVLLIAVTVTVVVVAVTQGTIATAMFAGFLGLLSVLVAGVGAVIGLMLRDKANRETVPAR